MNCSFILCENLELPIPSGCTCMFPKSHKSITDEIIEDINQLLIDSKFNKMYISTHIINKLVQLTNSEHGMLLQVKYNIDNEPELHSKAITNIAWNLASRKFYSKYIENENLVFKNIKNTTFGNIFYSSKVVIKNDYNVQNNNNLPDGHPPIKRFLGIPVKIGNKVIAIIALCNKIKPYKKKDITTIQILLNIFGYLLINLNEF